MLQVDLFFSYGLSSAMAVAARKNLAREESRWSNRYALAQTLWLALAFVPQVSYLLWRFPAWETMFAARGYGEIPAWLAGLTPAALVCMGIAGFQVTARLMGAGRPGAAWAQVVWSMGAALFLMTWGWDGTGYRRVLYPGTAEEWRAGVIFPLAGFFASPVFYSLIVLESALLVPYGVLMAVWAREAPRHTKSRRMPGRAPGRRT